MGNMFGRIPQWLGTALILVGVVGVPVCYYAVGLALRREEACDDVKRAAALTAQCAADAAFWRDIAILGFATALGIGVLGVVIDRIRRLG